MMVLKSGLSMMISDTGKPLSMDQRIHVMKKEFSRLILKFHKIIHISHLRCNLTPKSGTQISLPKQELFVLIFSKMNGALLYQFELLY